VWRLTKQTWTVIGAPSNARITGWERVCDKIIEAKGAIVLDENFPDRPARAENARRGRPKDKAPQARSQEHALA
jgi:hypothetical protein